LALLLADRDHEAIGQAIVGVGRRIGIIARECAQAHVVRLDGVGHMGPISHASLVAPHLAFQPRQPHTLPHSNQLLTFAAARAVVK